LSIGCLKLLIQVAVEVAEKIVLWWKDLINDLVQGFPTFNLLCPPKPKYQMLRPPKKKSGPPKKTCRSFYVRIHYYSIRKKYHSVSRWNSEHKLLIFEKKPFKIAIIIANIAICIICPNTGVPLANLLRPPRGTRPPGWEPLV
jgi:hypothetical protein